MSNFITNTYASADNRLGRIGTPVAAGVVGAGVGAGVGYAVGGAMPTYAIGGAAAAVVAEEAGRLLIDQDAYKQKRLELAAADMVELTTKLFGKEVVAAAMAQ